MATPTELIAKIDIKIAAILDDTGSNGLGNYKIGDKKVDVGDYLKILNDMRKSLMAQAQDEPYEDIREIASGMDEFGVDISEYIGDATG
jgi:hypothetical protein